MTRMVEVMALIRRIPPTIPEHNRKAEAREIRSAHHRQLV
jgi:hypothetical protein